MLGTVEKENYWWNENAYYVQIDGITYELKKQEITQDDIPKVGDEIEGFIYDNKHHDREMTQFYRLLNQINMAGVRSLK